MRRFYCTELPGPDNRDDIAATPHPLSADGGAVKLDPDQSRHLSRVLRLGQGDPIELFDGKGTVAQAVVESCGKQVAARIISLAFVSPARPGLDLAVCLPKGPRADDMVSQLSQLGVDRLVPLHTGRSVVDPGPGRLRRFRLAAVNSAKQCGRPYLLEVGSPASVAELLGGNHDLKLIADPDSPPIDDLSARVGRADRILVLIGPEGGWTDAERAGALEAGCLAWSFAENVLRIESAAVAAASIVRYLAPPDRPGSAGA